MRNGRDTTKCTINASLCFILFLCGRKLIFRHESLASVVY